MAQSDESVKNLLRSMDELRQQLDEFGGNDEDERLRLKMSIMDMAQRLLQNEIVTAMKSQPSVKNQVNDASNRLLERCQRLLDPSEMIAWKRFVEQPFVSASKFLCDSNDSADPSATRTDGTAVKAWNAQHEEDRTNTVWADVQTQYAQSSGTKSDQIATRTPNPISLNGHADDHTQAVLEGETSSDVKSGTKSPVSDKFQQRKSRASKSSRGSKRGKRSKRVQSQKKKASRRGRRSKSVRGKRARPDPQKLKDEEAPKMNCCNVCRVKSSNAGQSKEYIMGPAGALMLAVAFGLTALYVLQRTEKH